MRHHLVTLGLTITIGWVFCYAEPVEASSSEAAQTPPVTTSAGVNPFESPDADFDKFPVPGDLPASAGTVPVPKAGPWSAMNFLGEMVCKGIVNLNLPLKPVSDSGTIEVRNGGQTLFGDGFSDDTEDITMKSVPGLIGRYSGVVAGSPGGVPMSIDYYWQVVNDEWIIGYLTSHVDTQGMTCNMFRTYELTYKGKDRKGDLNERVQICHRPPGNPDNEHTITVGAPAVQAHLGHGDSRGACP